MSRHLLYVIGVPGSGKTTLVRELVLGRRRRVVPKPFAHTVYEDGLVQLGRDRQGHGGTDALSMSVQPHVIAALQAGAWERILAEGDRLANTGFFAAAQGAGYGLTVVLLTLPAEAAAARRSARGTHQDERWLRGRESKVANLWAWAKDNVADVRAFDATLSAAELAALLADHPAIRGE